tara:strand:+ start:199 stop:387 length:189 start_codon:yes stop_codon:yes gene_type:complete
MSILQGKMFEKQLWANKKEEKSMPDPANYKHETRNTQHKTHFKTLPQSFSTSHDMSSLCRQF